MSWDYSGSAGIRFTKHHRIFMFYDMNPFDKDFHYVGFFVDDGIEYSDTVLARFNRDVKTPTYYPDDSGIQGRML